MNEPLTHEEIKQEIGRGITIGFLRYGRDRAKQNYLEWEQAVVDEEKHLRETDPRRKFVGEVA